MSRLLPFFLLITSCGVDGLHHGLLDDLELRETCITQINESVRRELNHSLVSCRYNRQGCDPACCQPLRFEVEFDEHEQVLLEPVLSLTFVKANDGGLFWGHLERDPENEEIYELDLVFVTVKHDQDPPPYRYETTAERVRFPVSFIANELARTWSLLRARITAPNPPQPTETREHLSIHIVAPSEELRYVDPGTIALSDSGDFARRSLLQGILLDTLLSSSSPEQELDLPLNEPDLSSRLLRWLADNPAAMLREPWVGRPARVIASRLQFQVPADHGPYWGPVMMNGWPVSPVWLGHVPKPLCGMPD